MPNDVPTAGSDLEVAQLEKTRAEADKLKAERTKIEQEAAAIQAQSRGAFWSEALKITGAVVIGIGGFVTALGGIMTARTQFELAELKANIASEKLKAAESAASAASRAASDALELRGKALAERDDAAKAAQELRTNLAVLTTKAQEARPDLVKSRLVYIQFRGSLTRALIDELRRALQPHNFNAPGAERLGGDYEAQVKYFRPEDRSDAERLLKLTGDFFADKGCPIHLRLNEAKATASSPPLELWLPHSCVR